MGDEKLAAICGRAGIGHRQHARFMTQGVPLKLIAKPVTGAAAASAGWIATLNHKVADHPVKGAAIVVTFFGQKDKVVDRIGRKLGEQLDHNVAFVGADGCRIGFCRINLHRRRSRPLLHK